MSVCLVCDSLQKIIDKHFVSPIGLRRNYFVLKATGSKAVVNLLSRLDGSGHYDTLKNLVLRSQGSAECDRDSD